MLFFAILLTAAPELWSGCPITSVVDGDTFTVLHGRQQIRVRLDGIDAPEKSQPFSERSREQLSQLLGRRVTLRVTGQDQYGRKLVEALTPDGRSINQEMVRAGWAWWFRRYAPRNRALEALELEAREARRGLWREEEPTPPWEFRRLARHKVDTSGLPD